MTVVEQIQVIQRDEVEELPPPGMVVRLSGAASQKCAERLTAAWPDNSIRKAGYYLLGWIPTCRKSSVHGQSDAIDHIISHADEGGLGKGLTLTPHSLARS